MKTDRRSVRGGRGPWEPDPVPESSRTGRVEGSGFRFLSPEGFVRTRRLDVEDAGEGTSRSSVTLSGNANGGDGGPELVPRSSALLDSSAGGRHRTRSKGRSAISGRQGRWSRRVEFLRWLVRKSGGRRRVPAPEKAQGKTCHASIGRGGCVPPYGRCLIAEPRIFLSNVAVHSIFLNRTAVVWHRKYPEKGKREGYPILVIW